MKLMVKQKVMKRGLISSLRSSYLKNEITEILNNSRLQKFTISENSFGLVISGVKE
jgi:hypothetical protein